MATLPVTRPPRSRPRLAVGLVALAVLVGPAALGPRTPSPARAALRQLEATPAIAVVGDSRAHVGVSPARLSESLAAAGLGRVAAHNFAVDGSDVLHHRSFVVNDLLERERLPAVIVWAAQPLAFDASRAQSRLDQLVAADVEPLARAGAPVEVLLDVATSALLPGYRDRGVLRAEVEDAAELAGLRLGAVQETLLGLDWEPRPRPRLYVERPDGQKPFRVLAEWERRFGLGVAGYRRRYQDLVLGDWHLDLARDLARSARARRARLVILEMPVAASYRREHAAGPKHTAWRALMEDLAAREGAVWMSHADRYDDDRAFGDPAHMHEDTAADYSRFLGEELAADPRVRAALGAMDDHRQEGLACSSIR